ncbi:MAG TPA: oxygenase MpaB family protein [Micromonosporaceae bacterium]|nr:oxygenase MpaB family protein [Micromonosporaceae bacterium]
MTSGDDLGLFGPDSVTWRVHAEPVLIFGGLRSLYLQALHPRAIAGVVQNSAYKTDPTGRFVRTAQYVATVIYGTTAQAHAAGARVQRVHSRLRATDPRTGVEFRLDEPELLRWVHITEVESFLTTAQRAGLSLTPEEADRYYAEQRAAAELVGLDPATVPGSVAEVQAYYTDMRPKLAMTRDAADTALFLSVPPLPWLLGYTPVRGAYLGVASLAVALLPAWARQMYGLPGFAVTDLSASLSARAMRLIMNAVPHRFFEVPIYQAAMARLAAHPMAAHGWTAGASAAAGQLRR